MIVTPATFFGSYSGPALSGPLRIGIIGDSITDYNIINNTKGTGAYPTTVSNANPCQISRLSHDFVTGDTIYNWGYRGMTQFNGALKAVTVIDGDHYTLDDTDSTGYPAWISGSGEAFAIKNASFGTPPRGYLNAAQIISGHRLLFFQQNGLGIASETTTNMKDRIAQSALPALALHILLIMGGTNDFTSSVSASTVITNVQAMMDYAHNTLGIPIILGTVPPRNSDTSPQKAQRTIYNDWVRTQSAYNVWIWDYEDDVSTARNSFTWKTGYDADGVHPNARGAYYMGRTLADVITARCGLGAFSISPNSVLGNPTLSGTGGTASGLAFTSNTQIGAGWTATHLGTLNASYRTLSKGANDEQQIAMSFPSGGASQEGVTFSRAVTNLPAGWYRGNGIVNLSGYTGTAPLVRCGLSINSSNGLLSHDYDAISGTPSDPLPVSELIGISAIRDIQFRTMPFYYDPAVMSSLTLNARIALNCSSAAGGITINKFQGQIYPVVSPYDAKGYLLTDDGQRFALDDGSGAIRLDE